MYEGIYTNTLIQISVLCFPRSPWTCWRVSYERSRISFDGLRTSAKV